MLHLRTNAIAIPRRILLRSRCDYHPERADKCDRILPSVADLEYYSPQAHVQAAKSMGSKSAPIVVVIGAIALYRLSTPPNLLVRVAPRRLQLPPLLHLTQEQ